MMKLLKYELMRRKHLLIGAALSILFAEGLALLGVYNGIAADNVDMNGWIGLSVAMTVLLVVGGPILAFLDAVIKVYSDFKHKHGYMLFMTPQNGYKVMWAKTIFGVFEVLAMAVVIVLCLALSGTVADNLSGGVVSKFIAMMPFNTGIVIGTIGLGVLQGIAQLSIAILAITVSRAMVRGGGYNWLIALVMYFALAFIVNMVNGWLLLAFGVVGEVIREANETVIFDSALYAKYFIIGAATYVVWFAGCTMFSGRLVNRGIDL